MDLVKAISQLNKKFNETTLEQRPLDDWVNQYVFYRGLVDAIQGERVCIKEVKVWKWKEKTYRWFGHMWLTYPKSVTDTKVGNIIVGRGLVHQYKRRNNSIDFGILPAMATDIEYLNKLIKRQENKKEFVRAIHTFLRAYDDQLICEEPQHYDYLDEAREELINILNDIYETEAHNSWLKLEQELKRKPKPKNLKWNQFN